MSRKFSIIKTIDPNEIDKHIHEYTRFHLCSGSDDPYIFMSEDTMSAIETKIGANNIMIDNDTLANKIKNTSSVYGAYTGYKVFIIWNCGD